MDRVSTAVAALALAWVCGCAESNRETLDSSNPDVRMSPDARVHVDARGRPDAPFDPKGVDGSPDAASQGGACVGGDNRATDPATGHCYLMFLTSFEWGTARTNCQALSPPADLASVESAAENTKIGRAHV